MSTRSSLQRAALLLFTIAPVSVAQSPSATPPCPEWNLAADFRVSPDQANPNPDTCGNPDVWHFLESDSATYPAHIPSTYTLLPEFITDAFFIPGLEQWQGSFVVQGDKDKLPAVGINNTGSVQMYDGLIWPAGVLLVHPLFDELVVVGWRSPGTGDVSVSGGVVDLDSGQFDGIGWSIDHFDGFNNTTVASGSIQDGGSQEFQSGVGGASLASLSVNQDDFLYFVVDPQSYYADDSTGLTIVIRPASDCGATNYCTSTPNSSGAAATLSVSGSLSVGANDTHLVASGCPVHKPGLFFYGQHQAQLPMGNGYLCVSPFAPGLFRVPPVVVIDPAGHADVALDFDGLPASGAIFAGSTWNFQFWFRDSPAGEADTNLTDAVSVRFCP